MNKYIFLVGLVFIMLLVGCNTQVGNYKAASSISKNGFARDEQQMQEIQGQEIMLWGYIDYSNIYGYESAKVILGDLWSGEGPDASTWRFNLKDLLIEGLKPGRWPGDVEARLRSAGTADDIVASASHEVARISHHLGFALVPASDATVLRHVDFVALDASRVLVVLVASGDQVWHKVVKTDEAMLPSDLVQAANYLNEQFARQRLGDIRAEILERMQQERVLFDQLMALAFRLACATLDNAATQPRLHVHGASSLVEESVAAHDVPMETLRAVFAMLEEKHRLIRLLNEYIEGPGLTVVIGGEHVSPHLRSFSLVASTAPGGTMVGVIGPRRMRYARAITAVDALSRVLGRVLTGERN